MKLSSVMGRLENGFFEVYVGTFLLLVIRSIWPSLMTMSWWTLAFQTTSFALSRFIVIALTVGFGFCLRRLFRRIIRFTNSIWALFLGTTMVLMLLYSYIRREFSLLYPLNFTGALLWQAASEKGMKNLRLRSIWIMLLLGLSLCSGLFLPAFEAKWFQHSFSLQTLKGNALDSTVPLDNHTLFAWETDKLGDPWQGNKQPIFYIQGERKVYIQSQVYDLFDSNGWWYRSNTPSLVNAQSPIRLSKTDSLTDSKDLRVENYRIMTIAPIAEGIGLPMPAQVLSFRLITKRENQFNYFDKVDTLVSTATLPARTEYEVLANVPNYNAKILRQIDPKANVILPAWNFGLTKGADQIQQLALDITKQSETPYDKIQALVEYIKTHETYNLSPPHSEPGELVEDFLFKTHEGYCVHFASALAIMCSSLRYPARIVMGFVQDTSLPDGAFNPLPDKSNTTVRVLSQENAHSWAEVYFPGYGWIPFEATPGFFNPMEPQEVQENSSLPIDTQEVALQKESLRESRIDREEALNQVDSSTQSKNVWTKLGISVLSSILVFYLGRSYWLKKHWLRLNSREKIARLYLQMIKKLALKERLKEGWSPREVLEEAMRLKTSQSEVFQELISLVEEGLYGPNISEKQVERVKELIRKI